MAAVGIDFGNLHSVIGAARGYGVDILLNEFSSYTNFKIRIFGEAARTQAILRAKNTVTQIKRLISLEYDSVQAQKELSRATFKSSKLQNGYIGIHLEYRGEERIFTPEQFCAMFFAKLKRTAEMDLKKSIVSLVVACPAWFTPRQRQALIEASNIAGISSVRIISEPLAASLTYGIYKTDLPKDQPLKTVIIDFGHSSVQGCLVEVTQGRSKIIAVETDESIGGRDFDYLLAEKFANEFKECTGIDVTAKDASPRAFLRLLEAAEKVKKMMSVNAQSLPVSVDELAQDVDFHTKISRGELEELCSDLIQRLKDFLLRLKDQCKEIDSVELIGGSSRIPAFRSLATEIFGQQPRTTMNADEAVAKGCAWQATFYSPVHRPREFKATDASSFSIQLHWQARDLEGNPVPGKACIVSRNSSLPTTKILTFIKSDDFEVKAISSNGSDEECHLGTWAIRSVSTFSKGNDVTIKVKLNINLEGIFDIVEAYVVEETEQEDEEDNKEKGTEETEPKPKTKKTIKHQLSVKNIVPRVTQEEMTEFISVEKEILSHEEEETARLFIKNSVEEFSYALSEKISASFAHFIDEIKDIVNDTLDWLQYEGSDCDKSEYEAKLAKIKSYYDPIADRAKQAGLREGALSDFYSVISKAKEVVNMYSQGKGNYPHLPQSSMEAFAKDYEAKEAQIVEKIAKQNSLPLYSDPIVSVEEILSVVSDVQKSIASIEKKASVAATKSEKPTEGSKISTDSDTKENEQQRMDVD